MSNALNKFITPEQALAIRAPLAQAKTLPKPAFTSAEFFELEKARIFSRHWSALCFEQQAAQPGDLLPLEFCGMPLLAVRGDDGLLRIFHNIAPYDGCLAVIDPVQAQTAIITPYHGWRYDLSGKLLATPFWDGSETGGLAALGEHSGDLIEISSRIELGMVFINLSANPADFDLQLAPLRKILAEYRTTDLHIGRDENGDPLLDAEDLATNWKTHYENWALNVLHEAFTHEIYTESPQIPRVSADGEKTYIEHIDGNFMALVYREADFAETYQLEDLPFPHLGLSPEFAPEHGVIGSLFPNIHLAVFSKFMHLIIALPIAAGQTRTLRAQLYAPEIAAGEENLEDRLGIMADFHHAGQEDGRITEAVQKARNSPVYPQQFYAPFWDRMHYTFSNIVLNALEQDDNN